MEYKEYNEFENPEKKDYDLKVSTNNTSINNTKNQNNNHKIRDTFNELYFTLGAPELFELAPYGFTSEEFDSPSKESIEKLKAFAKDYQLKNTKNLSAKTK